MSDETPIGREVIIHYMLRNQEVKKRSDRINDSGLYECYICFSRLMRPSKCLNCHKSICGTHIAKLKNRCPNCRTEPFQVSTDHILDSYLKEVSRQEWETLDKGRDYQCMIEECQFKGSYVAMLKHRKKTHASLSIEDVMTGQAISDQARKASLLRNMVKKLIAYKMMELTLSAVGNTLNPDSPEEKKKHPNVQMAKRMAQHVANCMSPQCRKLWNTKWGSYIGRNGESVEGEFVFSECELGKQLNYQLGWRYNDPKH